MKASVELKLFIETYCLGLDGYDLNHLLGVPQMP